jgi:cytochrome c-type biogenesis protein CcmH
MTRAFGIRAVFVRLGLLVWLLGQASAVFSASQIDTFEFASAVEERRFKALIQEFRCPKCLNTNLAGSDAPIAQDLRKVVYRLVVTEGMTDQEVRDYLQARYGDFVLYNPPFTSRTWYIWIVPLALGGLGLLVLLRLRRSVPKHTGGLGPSEQARLKRIVGDTQPDGVESKQR